MENVNIINMHELVNAIKERNVIERNRLNFEKEIFEFNKQLNVSSVKTNENMAETMRSLVDKFDATDKAIQTLSANDVYLKKEIERLGITVANSLI